MKRIVSLALVGLALAAAPLQAQGPGRMDGPGRGGPGGGPAGAQFFLANTGELELTDQQVVRLAAIARRAHQRHQAMRESRPAPGAARQQPSPEEAQRIRQQMEQAREQAQADLREALAVLTPEQQARAFEMVARRGGPGGRAGMGPRGPDGGRGRGGEARGRPGAPPRQ